MKESLVYVRLENINHLVLSYGIEPRDFINGLPTIPANLLSISPVDYQQEIDVTTGLNVVLGQKNVKKYLLDRQIKPKCWLDFEEPIDLEQIVPREVAELLYLGHAGTQLRLPFYYKLQNNFAFLSLPSGELKVFYRSLNHFYQILAATLHRHSYSSFRDRKPLMSFRYTIEPLPVELCKELALMLTEGVLFDFSNLNVKDAKLFVPILLVPDQVCQIKWQEPSRLVKEAKQVGYLQYSLALNKWDLQVEEALKLIEN